MPDVPEPMLIRRGSWRTQPWKNGRGTTHEILRWSAAPTAGDDAFDLRLSVAELDGAQPFSLFPEYYRTLIPLEDTPLTLGTMPLIKHHAVHFPGDVQMETRGSGHASDLNVFSRLDNRAHVEVSAHETHRHSPPIWPLTRVRNLAVFALGPVQLRGPRGDTRELATYDTLLWLSGGAPVEYTASAPVVWIRF